MKLRRFILRCDNRGRWGVWDRHNGKWRGKMEDSFAKAAQRADRLYKKQKGRS